MATKRVPSVLAVCVVLATMLSGVVATQAGAATRHIDGTVVSKSSKDRSFRISTPSGMLRIRVNSSTDFERLSGFGSLRKGLEIEVDARQTSSGLLATQIETRGGGGGDDHGGGHGGSDDGPNHT